MRTSFRSKSPAPPLNTSHTVAPLADPPPTRMSFRSPSPIGSRTPSRSSSPDLFNTVAKKQLSDKDKEIVYLGRQLAAAEANIKKMQENELKTRYAEKSARVQLSATQTAAKRTSIRLQQATQHSAKMSAYEENRLRISQLMRDELESELSAADETLENLRDEYEHRLLEAEELRRDSLSALEERMILHLEQQLDAVEREHRDDLASYERKVAEVREELADKEQQLQDVLSVRERRDAYLRDCERAVQNMTEELLEARRGADAISSRLSTEKEESSALSARLREALQALEVRDRERAGLIQERDEMKRNCVKLQERVAFLETSGQEMLAERMALKQQLDELAKTSSLADVSAAETEERHLEQMEAMQKELNKAAAELLEMRHSKEAIESELRATQAYAETLREEESQLLESFVAEKSGYDMKIKELQKKLDSAVVERLAMTREVRGEMHGELSVVSSNLSVIREEYQQKVEEMEAAHAQEMISVRGSVQEVIESEYELRRNLQEEFNALVEMLELTKEEYERRIASLEEELQERESQKVAKSHELEYSDDDGPDETSVGSDRLAGEPLATSTKESLLARALNLSLDVLDEEPYNPNIRSISSPLAVRKTQSQRLSPRFKIMSEREALMALFDATTGVKWIRRDNWDSDRPLSDWYGVRVDESGHVIRLDLTANNLTGGLPFAIGNFVSLKCLFLHSNELTGVVPEALGYISALEYLNLSDNKFNGGFPDLSSCVRLREIVLSRNSFSGSISNDLEKLSDLEIFACQSNKLTLTIPNCVGSWTSLRELRINDNLLSGSLNPLISRLSKLEIFDASNNQLSGFIDGSLFIHKPPLRELYLFNNKLTGNIPSTLYESTSLEILSLQQNKLTGQLQSNISSLRNLVYLNVSHNELSGSIPNSMSNLLALEVLHLNANKFTGSVPSEIGSLFMLQSLVMSGNSLKGNIPESITNLHNLKSLFLSKNSLSGRIPVNIGNLSALQHLHLCSNQLSGPLPDSIVNMTGLLELFLNDNKLSGGTFGRMIYGISKSKVQAVLPKCAVNV